MLIQYYYTFESSISNLSPVRIAHNALRIETLNLYLMLMGCPFCFSKRAQISLTYSTGTNV